VTHVAYLFDTNAISEALRRRPNPDFVHWLQEVGRDEQFTSAVVIGELVAGAYRSSSPELWLDRIERFIRPRLTTLPFDTACAEVYGRILAELHGRQEDIGHVDTQIAATAIQHDLTVVTANVKHFERTRGLRVHAFTPGDGSSRRRGKRL
jgi:predicted nucleic acid-binding protein